MAALRHDPAFKGDTNLAIAYEKQRTAAGLRGIGWEFTPETWMRVWLQSGHLDERGVGTGRFVMARHGDVGPYSPSNVEIVPFEVNARDSRINHPETTLTLSRREIGKGRGWSFVRNGYQVSVARRYVGRFRTQEEAEAAYARAVALRRKEGRLTWTAASSS
jgi:hypothetical protein